MHKSFFIAFAVIIVLFCSVFAGADIPSICINEIMTSNDTAYQDNYGNYSDWVELYNYGNVAVDLEGYGLSDNESNPYKFTFGAGVTIQPGGYLIIFASDLYVNTGPYLHAPYGIKAAGEPVVLTMPDGTRVDIIPPTQIDTDMSYGRQPDASDTFVFFNECTPGAANTTQGYLGKLQGPLFMRARGFYAAGFNLTIIKNVTGSTIRYTLDGSEPTESSPEYTTSIPISAPTGSNKVKVTVVRVKVFKEGFLPSPIFTHTYIVGPDIFNKYKVAVVSLSTDSANLFDNEIGIYVTGNYNNYMQRGSDWERTVNIEFFEPNGTVGFACEGGLRLHGGWTRHLPQKSFRVYADHQRGPGSFNYKIFADSDITDYKRIIIRNNGNDNENFGSFYGNHYTLFKDGLMQGLVEDLDVDTQNYRQCVMFMNGEYWGLYGVHERQDIEWLSNHFPDLDKDNVDLIQQDTSVFDVSEGDTVDLEAFRTYMQTHDMRNKDVYEYVKSEMDISNVLIHLISEIYAANTDWPGNNIRYWQPKGEGGKWRWALCDLDFSFGLVMGSDYEMLSYATTRGGTWPNPDYNSMIFSSLLRNNDVRNEFINRTADMLNSVFLPQVVINDINYYASNIEDEVENHFNRWRGLGSYGANPSKAQWLNNVEVMREFARTRPGNIRKEYCKFFSLTGCSQVNLNVNDAAAGKIKINTLTPDTYPWSGSYFNEIPIELEAIPNDGYRFVRWEGVEGAGTAATATLSGSDLNVTAVFEVI